MATKVPIEFAAEMSALKTSMQGMESYVKGWGLSIKTAIAGAVVDGVVSAAKSAISHTVSFMKESFAEAASAMQGDSKLATALRNTGEAAGFTFEELNKLAGLWQDKTLFDDDAIKAATTTLVNFGNIVGDNMLDAIHTSQDLATVWGTDVAGAAETLGQALANPERAVMMLTRAKIKLTDAEKDAINAMAKAGDVAGAQAAILEALNRTVGGQAENAAKTSGALQQLANVWADVKEEAGRALVPIVQDMLPGLKMLLQDIGAIIVEMTKGFADWFRSWADGMDVGETASEKFIAGLAIIEKRIAVLIERTNQFARAVTEVFTLGFADAGVPPPIVRLTDKATAQAAILEARQAAEAAKKAADDLRGRSGNQPATRPKEPEVDKDLMSMISRAVDEVNRRQPEKDKGFTSSIESGASVFHRIASEAASVKPVEEKQLTALELIAKWTAEKKMKDNQVVALLQQLNAKPATAAVGP